jgi:hypothetical protein
MVYLREVAVVAFSSRDMSITMDATNTQTQNGEDRDVYDIEEQKRRRRARRPGQGAPATTTASTLRSLGCGDEQESAFLVLRESPPEDAPRGMWPTLLQAGDESQGGLTADRRCFALEAVVFTTEAGEPNASVRRGGRPKLNREV